MKKIILGLIILIGVTTLYAQQIIPYTMYMEDAYAINPAAAGSLPYNPLSLAYKRLWSGIDDAPALQMLNSHLAASERVGIGGKLFSMNYGPLSQFGIEGTYAYNFPVANGKLALGLSGILYQYYIDKSKLILENPDDEAVIFGSEKIIVPDAKFGAYYYAKQYYVGLAVHQLLGRKITLMNKENLEQRQVRHYFLHGGYIYDINGNYSIEPSALIRVIEAGIFQFDINVKGIYKQMVWAGFSYRLKDAIAIMAGFRKDRIAFGYAYDYAMSDIGKYNTGSHELIFTFKFNRSRPKL
ncbi:MAG: type IX secretion system membrane protein PorP/SprF [Bacteroidota bacterium]